MEAQDRLRITHNLVVLVHQTNLDSILPKLLEKGVFSERMLEKYQQGRRGTESQCKQELYMDIMTRGPRAYGNLVEALIETGHFDLARILRPGVNVQAHLVTRGRALTDTLPAEGAVHHGTVPICLPQYMMEEENQLQARLQTLALAHPQSVFNLGTEPLKVTVKQATRRMDQPSIKNCPIYHMGSRPKGYFFMINNVQFVNDIEEERTGAEIDERNLQDLFLGLGYEVISERNQGLADMKRKIQEFARLPGHSHMDSCVVAMLSHGHEGNEFLDDTNIVAADGGELASSWVIDCFKHQNCVGLQGKPKIFIFQTCRGKLSDFGVRMVAGRTQRDGISNTLLRAHADILVANSTVPGYTSNRDRFLGTWFIQEICKVFMNHAHDTDIEDMLKMVDFNLSNLISETGTLQTTCYKNFGFRKFYFNPGLYNSDPLVTDHLPPPDGPQG